MAYNPRPEEYQIINPLDQSTWTLPSNLTANTASAWESTALDRQRLEQQQAMQDAKAQAGSGIAQARSNMAMRGGLSSGARERMGQTGLRAQYGAQQQVGLAGAQARAAIGEQAAQLGSQEQQYNISNVLGQVGMQNQLQQQQYATQMAGWAGKEYAEAQRQAAAQSSGK